MLVKLNKGGVDVSGRNKLREEIHGLFCFLCLSVCHREASETRFHFDMSNQGFLEQKQFWELMCNKHMLLKKKKGPKVNNLVLTLW